MAVMRFKTTCPLFLVFCLSAAAYGDTVHVPADYPGITQAISAVRDGDEVVVSPGTYVENIRFMGKAITVRSSDGPDVTIIDGSSKNSVVVFIQGEGRNSVLEGFTITNGFGYFHMGVYKGGGILCQDSSPTIRNNTIENNLSYLGGGISCWGSGTSPSILDCFIVGNDAPFSPSGGSGKGGGILCYGSSALISGCTIKENTCEDRGGGICAGSICSPVIVNNLIDSNTALSMGSGFGGGFGSTNGVTAVIRNNVFTNNKAPSGGGLSLWGGEVTNNIIMYNEAAHDLTPTTSGSGGGMSVLSSYLPLTVKGNYIAYNTALTVGGGVTWDHSVGEFEGNVVCFNKACGDTHPGNLKSGGGLSAGYFSSNSKLTNNIIYENYAEDHGGGISILDIFGQGIDIKITNFTITNNSSPSGSAIYCEDTVALTATNSIIWDNSGTGTGIMYGQITPIISYSDVKGGWPGTGNIDIDPCFVNKGKNDYHLLYYSPCKDSGDNNAPYLTEQDFEGDPRIAEGTVDMGADEFYKHLYWTGDATPDGDIDVKFVDIPGTAPVGMWVGASVYEDPIHGSYGDWYIRPPFFFMGPYSPIPSPGGVFVISGDIPLSPAPPYTIYLQAVIGNKLTNLCEMNVTE